jgi:hypothetical protein
VRALRWRYLLNPVLKISTTRLFPVVVIGYMASNNNVLPVRMDGRGSTSLCTGPARGREQDGNHRGRAHNGMDGATMLLFLSVASLFVTLNSDVAGIERLAAIVFMAAIIAFFFFAVSHSRKLMKQLEAFGLRFVPCLRLCAPKWRGWPTPLLY